MMADVDIVHVPYRGGGPALADLLGGQVQVMFSNLPTDEYVASGKLRALAVTTAVRAKTMPNVPTIGEFVSGYEASVAFGLCGPKALTADIVESVNQALNASLADPSVPGQDCQPRRRAVDPPAGRLQAVSRRRNREME